MRAVRLRNVKTNEESELDVACVFVAIGHDPNTQAFAGKLQADPEGYLIAKNLAESKHPGVFIAGDVADRVYKTAVTAAGTGCAAAMDAERYLSETGEVIFFFIILSGVEASLTVNYKGFSGRRFAPLEIDKNPLKICDLTQFYSPLSGGVKRYVHREDRVHRRAFGWR